MKVASTEMGYPGSDFREPEGWKGASVRGPLLETAPICWRGSRTTCKEG
jgi:hypothetical protein